jgi:hypothetical protein
MNASQITRRSAVKAMQLMQWLASIIPIGSVEENHRLLLRFDATRRFS